METTLFRQSSRQASKQAKTGGERSISSQIEISLVSKMQAKSPDFWYQICKQKRGYSACRERQTTGG